MQNLERLALACLVLAALMVALVIGRMIVDTKGAPLAHAVMPASVAKTML